MSWIAFLLTNINPDLAIENEISRSMYGQWIAIPTIHLWRWIVRIERNELGADQLGHLCFEKSDSHVPCRRGSIYFFGFSFQLTQRFKQSGLRLPYTFRLTIFPEIGFLDPSNIPIVIFRLKKMKKSEYQRRNEHITGSKNSPFD